MSNVYYAPEEHGLEIFDVLDEPLTYEFHMLVVWKRKADGALLYAMDSG